MKLRYLAFAFLLLAPLSLLAVTATLQVVASFAEMQVTGVADSKWARLCQFSRLV